MTQSRIFRPVTILAAAAMMIVLASGCEINDPTKDLKVIVKTISRDNTVSVTLNDVVTGGVASSIVKVEIQGQDAGKVTDEVNNKLTSITVNYGFLTFAIQNGTTISAASPVKLILKITSAAYLDVNYPITITSGGAQAFGVSMVKKADMATAGIEQTSTPTTVSSDNTGKTTAPIAVQTAAGTQVTIPQGTTLKDASGNALTGKISVATTVYYPQAAALIPQAAVSANGVSSYPMLSLSVAVTDQSGKVASLLAGSTFVPVANTLKNPATGAPFIQGDKLKLGYTDPVTGQVVFTGECEYVTVTSSKISNSVKQVAGGQIGFFFPFVFSPPIQFTPLIAFFQSQTKVAEIHLGTGFSAWNFDKAPFELIVKNVTALMTGGPGEIGRAHV